MTLLRNARVLVAGAILLTLGVLALVATPPPGQAETGKKALFLTSAAGPGSLEAARTTALGFTNTFVTDAQWGAMTKDQFADYQLIVVGDTGFGVPAAASTNSQALADAVMDNGTANTKAGNRFLIGTDPAGHNGQGGEDVIETGIDFAGVQEGATGLYFTVSDGDFDYDFNGQPDVLDKLLPKLTIDATPGWTQNNSPPCGGSASLISNAAQFSTLSSSDIQGWFCSVHVSYPTFPSDWLPLAIATDTTNQPTCGKDVDTNADVCGETYLIIAGSGITATAPNLALTPTTATNPVGTNHTVKATVTNSDSSPRSGETVTFTVTGANAGASGTCVPASCQSDSNGEVTFTYTGNNVGDDTITASITVSGSTQQATAAKTWEAAGVGENAMVGRSKTFDSINKVRTGGVVRENLTGLRVLLVGQGDTNASKKSFLLPCDGAHPNQNLQIQWGFKDNERRYKFVMDTLDTASCSDSPAFDDGGPAPFDTIVGTATGTRDGNPGYKLEFYVADAGEGPAPHPGRRLDRMKVKITAPNGDLWLEAATSSNGTNRFIGEGNHDAVILP